MSLAKRIKSVARKHGFTMKEISCQLGVRPNNLSRTINNPNIGYSDLQKIAHAIGCDVNEFFSDENAIKLKDQVCPCCGEHLDISISLTITPSKKS